MQLDTRNLSQETEWDEIDFLLSRQVDGLILDVALLPETEARLQNEDTPLVFIDAPPALKGFDFIGTTDYEGMAEVTRYLIANGHRRIAYLGGLPESKTNLARRNGWEAALREAGIEPGPDWIFQRGFNRDDGIYLADRYFDELKNFSALACANDYVASGVIVRLHEAGVRVPEDFSVTGFADDEIAEFSYPALTSYHQPIEEIASFAAELLLKKLSEQIVQQPFYQLIPGKIVIRNSVIPFDDANIEK